MTDHLTDAQFADVVRLAPLVSIDLVIRDPDGDVLVGLRTNAPAKGFWFVPGGRIRKNETIRNAFARILQVETGTNAAFDGARFLGVFEHFYSDDRYGRATHGTHYVVLGYEVRFGSRPHIVLDAQHDLHRWMNEAELLGGADVHDYTKAYFAACVPGAGIRRD
jgi:colanic acid biosynthesis protein WcaH